MFGSIQYAAVVAVMTLAVGLLYVALAFAIGYAWDPVYIVQPAVGFSGVLFAMAVDEATLSPFPTRSVFGLFTVPTVVYPWIMMLVLQFAIPGISFIGHLSGVIVGFLYAWGAFRWIIPSMASCKAVEEWGCMRPLVRLTPFKLAPGAEVLREQATTSLSAQVTQACGFLACVCRPLTDCAAPLLSRVRQSRGSGAAPVASRGDASGGASAPDDGVRSGPDGAATASAARLPHFGLGGRSGAGGGSGAGGYTRVPEDEESTAGGDGGGSDAPGLSVGEPVGEAPLTPAERAERAKQMLAAAKARAAKAATAGVPSPRADVPPIAPAPRFASGGVLGERAAAPALSGPSGSATAAPPPAPAPPAQVPPPPALSDEERSRRAQEALAAARARAAAAAARGSSGGSPSTS
jgi:hypothetical protein